MNWTTIYPLPLIINENTESKNIVLWQKIAEFCQTVDADLSIYDIFLPRGYIRVDISGVNGARNFGGQSREIEGKGGDRKEKEKRAKR